MSNLPFRGGMSTATRNGNSLLMFGGENATNSYTNDFYQLTQTSETFNWQILEQNNPPPGTLYGQAVVTNNNNMYLLGGLTNTTSTQMSALQTYQFSFESNTWTASPNNSVVMTNTTQLPYNRKLHTATYDNQNNIYIYGGAFNDSIIFNDFFYMDSTTQQYTSLPTTGIPHYGHTASLLSNGKIVIIGGVVQDPTGNKILKDMNTVFVFDTKARTWENVNVTGSVLPSSRTSHSAIVTSDDRIIIFGGDNGNIQRQRMYLNAIGILDTKTWTWTVPSVPGIPPSRRSYASAGLLNGNYLTVAFGTSQNAYYNDINVYDITGNKWLQSFTPSEESYSSGLSGGIIAGVTVACVVLLVIILFLLWKFQSYVRWVFNRLHRDIWKPRTGEPVWAETTRIIFQVILLFIFSVFLAFVLRQAIDSPNITQTIEEPAASVQVPDVRFCFDGFPPYPTTDIRTPGVTCQTDIGYSCTQFIRPLNMSVFQPTFADNLGSVNCFLFRSPTDFILTSTSGQNNGSRLLFTFWGDQAIDYGRIHTSIYPKTMNPNTVIYNLLDGPTTLMPENAVMNWQINERNDIQATNVYDIQPFTYSALSYNLVNHKYLQSVGWNYVGFLPISNSTPEVVTNFRQEAPNPRYTSGHTDLGLIAIFPEAFVNTIKREVKMYTLVNALGFVGGIFGLLIAIQTWLFGFRPRSPWGVVHRWSTGDMKRSLLSGLRSKFKITESGIPLVHPVHHRFSVTDLNHEEFDEPETQRIHRVEERMQMLEMLFKAYYVDDEVFRSLDDANRAGQLNRMTQGRAGGGHPMNDSGRFPPPSFSTAAPRTEKMMDDEMSTGTSSMGKLYPNDRFPHEFSRHDTDQSESSNIPLTHTQHQHAPPYQPNTAVQMHDL
ncbi:hypothetical protein INT47_001281 [Mucor saturninus]|uniref:Attractin/MKLN-like beta-propeller domain-containing protein n=1 Tax=Mucor saturninus TaxID=64648 RepID=A0A8H7VB73_9FUNG|nr:hypothetical protein INT47_001281 [Mucor saturninus]